jgi:hypothetical protein
MTGAYRTEFTDGSGRKQNYVDFASTAFSKSERRNERVK